MKEKNMKKEKVEERPKYETNLHLRLQPEERSYLLKKAEEYGCTLSQAARMLMFLEQKNGPAKEFSASEIEKKKLTALRGARDEFRRISAMYQSVVESISLNKNLSKDGASRAILSLENMTIKLQKTLNSVLAILQEKEVHFVSKTYQKTGENDYENIAKNLEKIRDSRLKFYYMEKIVIIGFIAEDVQEYEKNGSKKMRFPVTVERRKKSGKTRVVYNVFSKKGDIFEYLKKGVQVVVTGTFTEDDNNEKVIFSDDIRLFGEV